jgi:hypothetical protein
MYSMSFIIDALSGLTKGIPAIPGPPIPFFPIPTELAFNLQPWQCDTAALIYAAVGAMAPPAAPFCIAIAEKVLQNKGNNGVHVKVKFFNGILIGLWVSPR